MLRPWRKPTNTENDDGDTILNTTFNAGSSQHHPQTPIHTSPLRCQSMPAQTGTVRMQETPVPAVPVAPQKPITPHIPLPTSPNSGSHLSQLSAPLFTEDRCSSTSGEELEVDAEVTLINRRNKPNRTFTHNSTTGRPISTPTTMDYTTQGDPHQAPSTPLMFMSTTTKNQFLGTKNFFIPDGSDRRIHDIHDKVFHAGCLENGNNAYLLELPGLEKMLHTRKFLMDEMSGQFYTVYGNSYQRMSMKPMLQQAWETGELIDQLAVMRQAFGYTKLTGPTPPLINGLPPTASTLRQPDDILSKKPEPKNIQYQPPTFSLDRPTQHLAMEERIQVHHNYISTISNRKHKKDLINRLKRSDPHNITAYKAEMAHHMAMHDDVLGRILTILKQDDYYRTLEELPVINNLRAYDDIQLFPELYDTTTIIERVTGEADLIKRRLRQPGMYPLPKTPLPSTSDFVPKPTPTFQPIAPGTSLIHHANNPQSVETSQGSSIPCGQQIPREATSTNSTPSQHTPPQSVVPPQLSTLQSPNPSNTHAHVQSNKTPQPSSPTQLKQQSPIRTDVNPSTQPFIPAAETQPVSSSPQQNVPKSANGERVKRSKLQMRQKDECICFHCNQPGHLKRNCPELPYCSKCRTREHAPVRCPNKPQRDEPTCEATEESRDQWKRT